MGQGFPHQLPVLDNFILHPHVRRVACDDVTISRALLLYKIAFLPRHNLHMYATLRNRDGFSYPHQEHMKDTFNALLVLCFFNKSVYICSLLTNKP